MKISLMKDKDSKTKILKGTIIKIQIHMNKIKTKNIMALKVIKRQLEIQMRKNRALAMSIISRKQKRKKDKSKDKNKEIIKIIRIRKTKDKNRRTQINKTQQNNKQQK